MYFSAHTYTFYNMYRESWAPTCVMLNLEIQDYSSEISMNIIQGLSQDLGTGCPKLGALNFLGVQILKGDHIILRFQP